MVIGKLNGMYVVYYTVKNSIQPAKLKGPFNYYVTLFLANFDPLPLVTKCHTGPYPRNVTLVSRPDLKHVMLKKECIITSKILMI